MLGALGRLLSRAALTGPEPAQPGLAGPETAPAATRSATNGSSTVSPWDNQWPGLWGARLLPENLAVVVACVNAIAAAIASLPARVFQETDDGKRLDRPDHPVARMIRQPNALQTWSDFLEWLIASALLQGNAVAAIDHDGAGRPTALYPIPWWACQPILVPTSGAGFSSPYVPNSRLVFDVMQTMMPWPLASKPAGFPTRYFADEVVFLKDRSDDGILGRSRISRAPDVLACGLGAQGFSSGIWQNGASLSGVLTFPGKLGKEASDHLAQSWRDVHSGGMNAGKTVVIEEGGKFDALGVSPEDAELLASRQFSVAELARLFGVPPPIIGDWTHSTFTNSATATLWFGSLTLLPWVQKIEREFDRVIFNDPTCHLAIDLGGMMRGDYDTRTTANVNMVRAGVMTADEARREEGLDPRGGEADQLRPQAVGGAPGQADAGEPEPRPNGEAEPGIRPTNGTGRPNGAA
jgi:HK97 family phage portal protein